MLKTPIVIFGGSGSIGLAFANYLLEQLSTQVPNSTESKSTSPMIYLADIRPPKAEKYQSLLEVGLSDGHVRYVRVDTRDPLSFSNLPHTCPTIFNFAAVHREPGHKDHEYFETNTVGAEIVTKYAENAQCESLLFTSSIAPYGPCDKPTNEDSLPCPNTPYGVSKLIAEKIHEQWLTKNPNGKLVIVRPGVIFGPGEGGNVSRMIQAIQSGWFFYCGNKKVVKAGGYIKELCHSMYWSLTQVEQEPSRKILYNFAMQTPLTFEQLANEIQAIMGINRPIRNIPYPFILMAGTVASLLMKPFGLGNAFNLTRLKKLKTCTNVSSEWLQQQGYQYQFTLNEALQDWLQSAPEDWQPKNIREIEDSSNFTNSLEALRQSDQKQSNEDSSPAGQHYLDRSTP